jgi:hypothetical protein
MAAVEKVGPDFIVSETTLSTRFNPTSVGLANGGFVIAWQEGGQGDRIIAQIYNAQGTKVGAEFVANTESAHGNLLPSITALSNGGFVIGWQSNPTGYGYEIKAQVFDAVGHTIGSELTVYATAEEDQARPALTGLANGGFAVTWEDDTFTGADGSGSGIRARLYGSDGIALGDQFLVNTQTNGSQLGPAIGKLANGGFVVTWSTSRPQGIPNESVSVAAQVFDAAGHKVGSELLVNVPSTTAQGGASVVGLTNGDFVVTWKDSQRDNNADAVEDTIKGQLFNSTGAKIGGEFVVNAEMSGYQQFPVVTALAKGGFVVTWQDDSGLIGDQNGYGVAAQVFDAAGHKVGGELLVNSQTILDQLEPTVAGLANGDFVISWRDDHRAPGTINDASHIDAQIFHVDYSQATAPRPAAHDFNGDGKSDILWRNDGGYVTDWASNGRTFQDNNALFRGVGSDWHIAGSGDFNGDGKADILWRNDGGYVTDWLSNGTSFADNSALFRGVGNEWHIAGTGDFNGDGKADILWRNDNGNVTDWLSNGTSFADSASSRGVGNEWHIAGTGDFNGDGKADILWRNDNGYVTDWLSNGTSFADNSAAFRGVGNEWHIAGTGDFNGDGKADILWRNDHGDVTDWLSNGTSFVDNPASTRGVGTEWQVASIGDYNGDGKDDILWRNHDGYVADWVSYGTTFVDNPDMHRGVGTDWHSL